MKKLPREEWLKEHAVYLKSIVWQKKRQALFRLRGKQCEKCGGVEDLCVHHLHYRNWKNEKPKDLQILCKTCHCIVHRIVEEEMKTVNTFEEVYKRILTFIPFDTFLCDINDDDNEWGKLFTAIYAYFAKEFWDSAPLPEDITRQYLRCYANLTEKQRAKIDFLDMTYQIRKATNSW